MKTSPLNLVQPDTWYNIPICVVKAFQVLLGHGRAQDNYICELTKQVRDSDTAILAKVAVLDRRVGDMHNSMHESLDFRDERYSERLRKMTVEHEKLVAATDQRVKELHKLIETEV